jgi:hypothetical protein
LVSAAYGKQLTEAITAADPSRQLGGEVRSVSANATKSAEVRAYVKVPFDGRGGTRRLRY